MPTQASLAARSKIFISYRRSESAVHAGRLSDQLTTYFGSRLIFIDTESIEPGSDFVEAIEDAVGSCKILLAVIGQQWLTCANEYGRRLDAPNDFVRLEIATALKRGIRVSPVLIQGATMPREQDLPAELARLARRNAWMVRDSGWKEDVRKLIGKIEGDITPPRPARYARYALIVLVTVISLLTVWQTLSGWGDSPTAAANTGFSPATPERKISSGSLTTTANTGPIKIGVYADITGVTFNFGPPNIRGIKMAADEINKMGGLNGRQLEILLRDDEGKPNQAANVVTNLIDGDRVDVIIGEVSSTNVLAAAWSAQEAKVPMIAPFATNLRVTQVGDYIFRVRFTDDFQGAVAARFAANSLKARRAAILGDPNSEYSRGMSQFFRQEFARLGGKIVSEQTYTQTDADFKGQLTSIRSAAPDVIFVPGYYGQVGVIAKQAKELGINAPLLGGDGWDAPQLWDLGGAALNGSYMVGHYAVDDPSPAVQKFVAAYEARYGDAPDATAALGYDAMNVLADAIRRAGTTDSAKLRDAIAQTKNFSGVTGLISINESRDAVKPAVVFELSTRTELA